MAVKKIVKEETQNTYDLRGLIEDIGTFFNLVDSDLYGDTYADISYLYSIASDEVEFKKMTDKLNAEIGNLMKLMNYAARVRNKLLDYQIVKNSERLAQRDASRGIK